MKHLNMNEAFRRWPLGMSTFAAWADLYGAMFREWHGSPIPFDDWLFERLRPLLEAPANIQVWHEAGREWTSWVMDMGKHNVCEALGQIKQYAIHTPWHYRIVLRDGTVIRKWPTDEYDGIF